MEAVVTGCREGGEEAGEVKRGVSLQGFGGDTLKFVLDPKAAKRSLQSYLSLSSAQADIEGKNGNRGSS